MVNTWIGNRLINEKDTLSNLHKYRYNSEKAHLVMRNKNIILIRSYNRVKRRVNYYTRLLEKKFRKKKWIAENNLPNTLHRLGHSDWSNLATSLEEGIISIDIYKNFSREKICQIANLGSYFKDPVLIKEIIGNLINKPIFKRKILFDVFISKFLNYDREFCMFVFPPSSNSYIKKSLQMILKTQPGKIARTRTQSKKQKLKNALLISNLLSLLDQIKNCDVAFTFNVPFPFLCFWIGLDCDKISNICFKE